MFYILCIIYNLKSALTFFERDKFDEFVKSSNSRLAELRYNES